MFVPYSLIVKLIDSDVEFKIIIPAKGKKVSWLNRQFLNQYKIYLKTLEVDIDYTSVNTNFYDNQDGKNNIFQCLASSIGNNQIDWILNSYHNCIDSIPENYYLVPVFANVNDHVIDQLCARAYTKLCRIGKGGFSEVFLVRQKNTGKIFSMKIIDKMQALEDDGLLLKRELELMRKSMVHPLIVNLHYSFPSEESYHLVMEYVPGGNLYKRLKNEGRFEEVVAIVYFLELLWILEFLHQGLGILFRDIKVIFILYLIESVFLIAYFRLKMYCLMRRIISNLLILDQRE